MVWALTLLLTDISTRQLTPCLALRAFGVCQDLTGDEALAYFGEYELSPSLIGLSLLPTTHPSPFQRKLVRASKACYCPFTLVMGRSLGFASAHSD